MIRLADSAFLFRDGLVLTTAILPKALSNVLPPEAEVIDAELHALTQRNDGKAGTRSNDLLTRIDMSGLGQLSGSGPAPESMAFAAHLAGYFTERTAAEFVVEAIDLMAYDLGYLDPRIGINALRYELGISTAGASA